MTICILKVRHLPFHLSAFLFTDFIANPPVLKLPARDSHCPMELDDWRDLGGEYCYYIQMENPINFYEASFDCRRRGKYILYNTNIKYIQTLYASEIIYFTFSFL